MEKHGRHSDFLYTYTLIIIKLRNERMRQFLGYFSMVTQNVFQSSTAATCHWQMLLENYRIQRFLHFILILFQKPSSLTRIVLKIRSTGFNNPDHIVCGRNDTSYLEVKYKRDKVPTGARLCDNTWWLRHEPARAGLTMMNINADDEVLI